MLGISGYGNNMNLYNMGSAYSGGMAGASAAGVSAAGATAAGAVSNVNGAGSVQAGNAKEVTQAQLKALKRSGAVECATCASRKYQDGSNESDVSFKSAAHISPQNAAGKVMAHEQEHVANAFQKAGAKNGRVVSATVKLHTAICPECGRSFVSGGVTNTAIKYPKDNFGKNQKSADYGKLVGNNIDYKG